MLAWSSRKLALVIEYDGSRYHGFQAQAGSMPTIQGDIERALARVTGEKIRITGAGRTDAGVHAKGQVVSFGISSNMSVRILVRALNYYLRPDIAVREGSEVDPDFSARRDAIGREYRYTIQNRPTPSPLQRRHACFVPQMLNSEAMNEASQSLVGTHDLASFATAMKGGTTRTVSKAVVSRIGEFVLFDMVANAFLPRQVRLTVGCLIRVGLGKISVERFREILQAKKPGLAAWAAPAHGLCLMKVNYPEHKLSRGRLDENL